MLTNDNPVVALSLKALEVTHDAMLSKKVLLKIQGIKTQLRLYYSVKPGSMLTTNVHVSVRKEISQDNLADRIWYTIPQSSYVMFIDVVHDKNFDLPVLKLLWNQRIVYVHYDTVDGTFDQSFGKKFIVVVK